MVNVAKLVIVVTVFLLVFCVGIAGAAPFSMERKNASVAYTAISSGDTVYRGDTVRFTATGGSGWNWTFGDGFTASGQQIIEHRYTFGKVPILMHDGWVSLPINLRTNDGAETTHTINFTTLLPPLVFEQHNTTLLNENLSVNYTEALTGNRTAPPGWSGFDWVRGIEITVQAYTQGAGEAGGGIGMTIFLILIFSIPFIMNWIIMKDFIVSGILGGFLGIFIIARLPGNMQALAVAFIVMSVVAIIYSLLKET